MKNLLISVFAGSLVGAAVSILIVGISGQATLWTHAVGGATLWTHAVGGAVAGCVAVIFWAKLRSRSNGLA